MTAKDGGTDSQDEPREGGRRSVDAGMGADGTTGHFPNLGHVLES